MTHDATPGGRKLLPVRRQEGDQADDGGRERGLRRRRRRRLHRLESFLAGALGAREPRVVAPLLSCEEVVSERDLGSRSPGKSLPVCAYIVGQRLVSFVMVLFWAVSFGYVECDTDAMSPSLIVAIARADAKSTPSAAESWCWGMSPTFHYGFVLSCRPRQTSPRAHRMPFLMYWREPNVLFYLGASSSGISWAHSGNLESRCSSSSTGTPRSATTS